MLHGRTRLSSVCAHLHHTGCPVNFGSGVRCQCTCHSQNFEIIKERSKTFRVTAYFEEEHGTPEDPGVKFNFGLIGPEGKERFDTCIDMIKLLCEGKVRIDLEVETASGPHRVGGRDTILRPSLRALRMIKPKSKRRK